jgi:hypothetical protein
VLKTHLVPDYQPIPSRCPRQGKGLAETRHLVEAVLSPYVPELYRPVAAYTTEFSILDGVECHLLYGSRVAFEVR